MNKVSWIVVAAACAVAVSLRLIDRPEMNFSALGALAVLCGAVVRPAWVGVLIPLGCRVLTDGIIEAKTSHGFYGSWMFDYAAYVAIFALGRWLQPKSISMAFGTGLLAGAAFFTISNLGVWCMPHEAGEYLYPRTLAGLTNCFLNAIPFALGTFTGDIGFTVVFTGAMQLLALSVKQESPAVNQTATADR